MGDVLQFPKKHPRALSETEIRAVIRENAGILGIEFDKLPSLDLTATEWRWQISGVLAAYPHIMTSVVARGFGISLRQAVALSMADKIARATEVISHTAEAHDPLLFGALLQQELLPTSCTVQELWSALQAEGH